MFNCTKCKEPPYAERHVRWCERSENKGNRRKTPKILCFPPTRFFCPVFRTHPCYFQLGSELWPFTRTNPCFFLLGSGFGPVFRTGNARNGLRAGLPAFAIAGQSGTGDPRLPFPAHVCSLLRHPLAGGGMPPHAAPPRSWSGSGHPATSALLGSVSGQKKRFFVPNATELQYLDKISRYVS